MQRLYDCSDRLCEGDRNIYSLDKAIEHLRARHKLRFIGRPNLLGEPDSHGHIWYCFVCPSGQKDHRSFDTSCDMWNHLSDCHDHELDKIQPYKWQWRFVSSGEFTRLVNFVWIEFEQCSAHIHSSVTCVLRLISRGLRLIMQIREQTTHSPWLNFLFAFINIAVSSRWFGLYELCPDFTAQHWSAYDSSETTYEATAN